MRWFLIVFVYLCILLLILVLCFDYVSFGFAVQNCCNDINEKTCELQLAFRGYVKQCLAENFNMMSKNNNNKKKIRERKKNQKKGKKRNT